MRVLVTRPESEARRTAAALHALGHDPVLLPVTQIVATGFPVPEARFDAVVATSANAFAGSALASDVLAQPLYAVGERTAEAARRAGFAEVRIGSGDAAALSARIRRECVPGAQILFLAGSPRKPELEATLTEAGIRVLTLVTYRSLSTDVACPDTLADIDAVLHYSRASAERFAALVMKCRLDGPLRHLCLSADVARGLKTLPKAQIFVAERPDESSLFGLLNTCCSGSAG